VNRLLSGFWLKITEPSIGLGPMCSELSIVHRLESRFWLKIIVPSTGLGHVHRTFYRTRSYALDLLQELVLYAPDLLQELVWCTNG
jgi:hypothetical protein